LVQTGKMRDPQFANVPTVYELMNEHKTPQEGRELLTTILATTDLGRPIIGPPGEEPGWCEKGNPAKVRNAPSLTEEGPNMAMSAEQFVEWLDDELEPFRREASASIYFES
jgi:hypothetical protein